MKKSLLGIIVLQALTVSSISPISLANLARAGARPGIMRAVAQRGVSTGVEAQRSLTVMSNVKKDEVKKDKEYSCDHCMRTLRCRAYRRATGLAFQEESGPIARAEVIQALRNSAGIGICSVPVYWLWKNGLTEWPHPYKDNSLLQSKIAVWGGIGFFSKQTITQAARLASCLKNANDEWWIAREHRVAIAIRRDNWIDRIVDGSNWIALKVKGRVNPNSAAKNKLGERCCKIQKKLDGMLGKD